VTSATSKTSVKGSSRRAVTKKVCAELAESGDDCSLRQTLNQITDDNATFDARTRRDRTTKSLTCTISGHGLVKCPSGNGLCEEFCRSILVGSVVEDGAVGSFVGGDVHKAQKTSRCDIVRAQLLRDPSESLRLSGRLGSQPSRHPARFCGFAERMLRGDQQSTQRVKISPQHAQRQVTFITQLGAVPATFQSVARL